MSDETTLLPCPLCGGEMSVALHGDEFGWYWWTVQRGHDDATACHCRMFVESDMKFTLEDHENPEDYPYAMELKNRLVRKWNTRHVETCELSVCGWDNDTIQCMACGAYWEHQQFDSPDYCPVNYCPSCGAKIVQGVDNADK